MRFLLFIVFSIFFSPSASAACTDPDGIPGELMYNGSYDVFQGCTTRGWMAFHLPDMSLNNGPQACPNIGDVCTSGIIYAGEYAGHKLYVAGADAPGTYTWNNGTADRPDLDDAFMPNCSAGSSPRNGTRWSDQSNPACMGARGKAFTEYLAGFTGAGSPYKAASYCYHLGKASDPAGPNNTLAHGRDDWYLPAVDELEFIYDSLGPEGNHNFQSADYWSSTEYNTNNFAWTQHFMDGFQFTRGKPFTSKVRCVAR